MCMGRMASYYALYFKQSFCLYHVIPPFTTPMRISIQTLQTISETNTINT